MNLVTYALRNERDQEQKDLQGRLSNGIGVVCPDCKGHKMVMRHIYSADSYFGTTRYVGCTTCNRTGYVNQETGKNLWAFIITCEDSRKVLLEALPDAKSVLTYGWKFGKKQRRQVQNLLDLGYKIYILFGPNHYRFVNADTVQKHFKSLKQIHLNPEMARVIRRPTRLPRQYVRSDYSFDFTYEYGIEHCDPEYLRETITKFIESEDKNNANIPAKRSAS